MRNAGEVTPSPRGVAPRLLPSRVQMQCDGRRPSFPTCPRGGAEVAEGARMTLATRTGAQCTRSDAGWKWRRIQRVERTGEHVGCVK